jgi:hypothetical protein
MSSGNNLTYVGLNFKLDVGLYRLDQQVACQRYRQNQIVAEKTTSVRDAVANLFERSNLNIRTAQFA